MYKVLLIFSLLGIGVSSFGQVSESNTLFAQDYSKEITEYLTKEFIVNELLNVPDRHLTGVEIDAITASASGELTVVLYNCKSLNKSGLIFVFWNKVFNEFNTKYNGYAYKNLDVESANKLFSDLSEVLDQKIDILEKSNDITSQNAVYKCDDLTFVFYRNLVGANLIRVLWNGFDSAWNQDNLKTTVRRFNRFFDIDKKK